MSENFHCFEQDEPRCYEMSDENQIFQEFIKAFTQYVTSTTNNLKATDAKVK